MDIGFIRSFIDKKLHYHLLDMLQNPIFYLFYYAKPRQFILQFNHITNNR